MKTAVAGAVGATVMLVGLSFAGCGKYPDSVTSPRDVQRLPTSTQVIFARRLPDSGITSLSRLTELRDLDFCAGFAQFAPEITDAGLASLASLRLPYLSLLHLGYCTNITDSGLHHAALIDSLRTLRVEGCPHITDAGLQAVATMTNLTFLDLRGCSGITDRGLEYLSVKTNWEAIRLGGCPGVTAEAVSRLQTTIPWAEIKKDDAQWSQQNQ